MEVNNAFENAISKFGCMKFQNLIRLSTRRPKNKKEVELHDLDDFFGTWTEEEFRLIKEGCEQARNIDEKIWKTLPSAP
jgi:hypothetical protein